MNLKKSIVKVFSANFLQLISNLVVGFVVPIILSIEGYAELKTYTLFVSYIGLFHLGFIDGLYIKYGGKKLEDINKENLKGEHYFLILFQLMISIIVFFTSLVLKNISLFLLSISILPIMIQTFHKYIYQATGNFDKYSRIVYVNTLTYMILNILLAIVFRSENYILYCLTTFCANLLSIIIVEIKFVMDYKEEKTIIDKKEILNTMKVGFLILIGNLAVVGLFGIDRWFVKIFLSAEDFAYYSFAVSMLNIINILVNAISITLYNYLFTNNDEQNINKLKRYLISLGGMASLGFFILSFIVNNFIMKYIPSLNIIAITFAVFPYMILINALYINLYKVNKNEKKYFKVVVSILLVSILYNIIALILFHNTISIAFATILTLITWVIYSTHDLKKVKEDKRLYIYMFLLTGSFLLFSHYLNWLLGGLLYFIIYIVLTYIFNRDVFYDLKNIVIYNLNRNTKKKGKKDER